MGYIIFCTFSFVSFYRCDLPLFLNFPALHPSTTNFCVAYFCAKRGQTQRCIELILQAANYNCRSRSYLHFPQARVEVSKRFCSHCEFGAFTNTEKAKGETKTQRMQNKKTSNKSVCKKYKKRMGKVRKNKYTTCLDADTDAIR